MNAQNVISNAVVWLREFLATVGFDKWYGVLVAIVSSFASELLFALVIQFGKERRNDRHPKRKDEVRITFMKVLLYIVVYIMAYAAFLAVSVLAYVITQNIRLGTSGVWWNFLKTITIFWDEYKEIMIVIPVVLKVLNLADKGRSQVFRSVIIIFLIMIMLFSPSMITYPAGNRLAIEPLLLAQLRETPFPFVTKFYNDKHFWSEFGYVEPDDESGQNGLADRPLPSGETENMDYDELMEAAQICGYRGEKELQKIYLDAAYELYQKGQYEDSFNVGLMWFYKGLLEESADFYYKGGEVYERISQYWNAVLCYAEAYKLDWTPEYAEKAIECHYQYEQDTETVSQRYINRIAELFFCMQGHYEDDIPHLDDFCDMHPDNLAIQVVRIMRHIKDGTFGANDMQIIEHLESMEQYRECPKLMLVKKYYSLVYENESDVDDIYAWYQQDSELYEPEDILNLAWFMYMNGEYTRAYKLATEAAVDGEALKDAYSLIAEIYLQDVEALPSLNGEELVTDLTEAVREVALWYNEDSLLRFNLTTLLLSNRVGLELDLSEVTSRARELFNGDTFTEGLIQATLDYEDGRYSDCVERCDRILDIDVPAGDLHKALFLKTDALIEMAKETNDQEERIQFLTEAEEAMKTVQRDVEGDYIECLNRLSAIYNDMPDRESERMAVNDILQAFE